MGDMADDLYDRVLQQEEEAYDYLDREIWVTREGKEIPVSKMEYSHLQHARNWCLRTSPRSFARQWIPVLEAEINRRDSY